MRYGTWRRTALASVLALMALPAAAGADTTIAFDDAGYAGQSLGNQYSGLGVTFSPCPDPGSTANQIVGDPTARSAPNRVEVSRCDDSQPSRMTAAFSSTQSRVSVWVRNTSLDNPQPVVLTAIDGSSGVVASASVHASDGAWTQLSVSQPAGEAPRIAFARIERANVVDLWIDDFTFGADAPGSPTPTPPPGGGAGGSAPPPPLEVRGPFTGLGHQPRFSRLPRLRSPQFLRLTPARLEKAYTEHLGWLVTAPHRGGPNELGGDFVMRGTDLGASFEVNGRLALLFGDSWTTEGAGSWDADSLAFTTARRVGRFQMPRLAFDRQAGGRFEPLVVRCPFGLSRPGYCGGLRIGGRRPLGYESDYPFPVIRDGGMEVPVEGLQVGNRVYVFYVNKYHRGSEPLQRYDYSVLASGPARGLRANDLVAEHIYGSERFLNVSAVQYRGWIYIYGAGNPYRFSAIALARVRPRDLAVRERWQYYRGGTRARWGPGEETAQYIVPDRCIGEFSVRRHRFTGLFVMAYGCGGPPDVRGYYLRFARTPWGPWSRPEKIMTDASAADGGYSVTMHEKPGDWHRETDTWDRPDDGLYEPDHLDGWNAWGGEYGPYMVPRWFRKRRDGAYEIVFLHSSWHPYKVHVMRTVLVEPGRPRPRPPVRGTRVPAPRIVNGDFTRGLEGWTIPRVGPIQPRFHVVPAKGRNYVTSYDHGGAGDGGVGFMYQDFTAHARTCWLEFRVHGGHATPGGFQRGSVASVRLYHRGQVVRETFGLDDNVRDVNARWNLQEFRGERLRLAIVDTTGDRWGFISATGFRLTRPLLGRFRRC
ncbi:MAG TPA: DUF4185 domain-containing protein [Solirubrobacteraceae bacterium]|nr:DUF4185 domain-containing protein [Solirubrobacteraceae bacterium]